MNQSLASMDNILDRAPDRADVLKMIQRIMQAIGKSDPTTAFVACSYIMQLQADLMGITLEQKK